jgi:hypothetical protein
MQKTCFQGGSSMLTYEREGRLAKDIENVLEIKIASQNED